jgi:hypothetical protein
MFSFCRLDGGALFGQTCCARAPTSLPFSPFSFLIFYRYFFLSSSQSDPLVRCWSVEELTMANMALFQIIVQQVLPFCVSIFYLNAFVDCQFLSPPKLQSLLSVAAVCATEGFLIRRWFNTLPLNCFFFLSILSFSLSLSLYHPPFALVCPAALAGDEAQKL